MIKKCSALAFAINFGLLVFLSLLFFGNLKEKIALAQVQNADIVLITSPQYPNPGQEVRATLNTRVTNLDKANISWSVNNQELARGIGMKSFSFKVGNAGIPTILSIIIDTFDGQSLTKSATITPAGVDILYEAYDSYVPPFYKGKALVPKQGTFKVVAIPNLINQTGKVNPLNLSYSWIKDGSIVSKSSGWGKNYFIFQNSYLDRENTIEVKVSDIAGGTNASKKINLSTVNPKIMFYKYDPLSSTERGPTLRNGLFINEEGSTIIAEPYFFSPKDLSSSDLIFDWYIGGEKIRTPDIKNILSIKPQGDYGSSAIKLIINNKKTLLQRMEKQINVSF